MSIRSRSPHNTFTYSLNQQLTIEITSEFDSGNLQEANLLEVISKDN